VYDLHYEVLVKFNKDFIDVDEAGRKITLGVRAKPIKGKANEEMIKKLAKYFSVPSSKIRIVAGLRSKNKIIEIIK
jgi:uncharacterized protein YggU (UPF0235/DUF167 family)